MDCKTCKLPKNICWYCKAKECCYRKVGEYLIKFENMTDSVEILFTELGWYYNNNYYSDKELEKLLQNGV